MIHENEIRRAIDNVYKHLRKKYNFKPREIWRDVEMFVESIRKFVPESLPKEHTLQIYSDLNGKTSLNRTGDWHKIVSTYDSAGKCLGGINPHWCSTWNFTGDGFSVTSFHDHNWKGWFGSYSSDNTYPFDQVPKDVVSLHIQVIKNWAKDIPTWLPCNLYDDMFEDKLYRP